MGKSSPLTFCVMIRLLLYSIISSSCIYFCRLIKLILFPLSNLISSLVDLHSISSYFPFPFFHNQISISLLLYEYQTYVSYTKILNSSKASTPNLRILSLPPPVPQPLPRWDLWNTFLLSTHLRCPDLLRFSHYF